MIGLTRQQTPPANTPQVVIYQNSDFVSGLMQTIFDDGLLETSERDVSRADNGSTTKQRTGNAKAKASALIPPVGGALAGEFHLAREVVDEVSRSDATRQHFVFSQPTYLKHVRRFLHNSGAIKRLAETDQNTLSVGDVVEFSASFSANELSAVLDIATPDLVADIRRYLMRRQLLEKLRTADISDLEQYKLEFQMNEDRATNEAELARSVVTAARADFRSEKTREYYGSATTLNGSITAITVCDAEHFVTADPDRLLDGEYTVLGKVTSSVELDMPVLGRNKLLRRIDVEFLTTVLGQMTAKANQSAAGQDLLGDRPPLDVAFSARIAGPSFTVLPIAVYV